MRPFMTPSREAWGPRLVALLALFATQCSPTIRPAKFLGARDYPTPAEPSGPFDGQVVDQITAEPITGATVVAVWSYDEGQGLIGPSGSDVVTLTTDIAGRYRVPPAPAHAHGPNTRLVSFELIVYKRGYVSYRSNLRSDGSSRHDFTQRLNRVEMRKWQDSDSHAEHLLFLSPPPVLQQQVRWERNTANLDLYREQTGRIPHVATPEAPATDEPELQLLDATALIPESAVKLRTGYTGAFDIVALGDLPRTRFYQGLLYRAVEHETSWDFSYRVWKAPPQGLDNVRSTFAETLPDTQVTTEITPETWVYDGDSARVVAFLDRDHETAVFVACLPLQCADIETVILLARLAHERIDLVTVASVEEDSP